MNILVTGGAGYVGSHAAKALACAGHFPVVYDDLRRGHESAVRWGPLVREDVANYDRMLWALRKYRIAAVMHFAAYAYVGESMANPGLYFANNAVGSLRLLQAVEAAGVQYVIFSSTCATYGNPLRIPIDEAHPQLPINPYGESKLFVEKLLRWYGEVHGLRWVGLRYFNAAGADPDGEIGECHEPETHLIPRLLDAALDETLRVSIFGTDYPTPDGTAIRDYVHVTDLARAHLLALDYLVGGGESVALNLGACRGYSVREVVAAVAEATRRRPWVCETGRRKGDPPVLIADAAKARRALGWAPRHSSLPDIVRTAWNWRVARTAPVALRDVAMRGAS